MEHTRTSEAMWPITLYRPSDNGLAAKLHWIPRDCCAISIDRGTKMKKTSKLWAIGLLAAAETLAQSSSGDFEITKSTIDNGGGISSGGEFLLTGTIGQPDASQKVATGGAFALSGGFWAKATVFDVIFKDNFESDQNHLL